jgi:hypothetical protein
MARLLAGIGLLAALSWSAEFHGQATAWAGAGWDSTFLGQAGLRYIPDLAWSLPTGRDGVLDFDLSANAVATGQTRLSGNPELDVRIKPYRLSARFSTPRFEARLGLQKVNFGSAMLLRPLQWFDRVDPRDPQAITDGVYGLLARYYFPNNANLWAWGLLGNSTVRGLDRYPSKRWEPEFGGRAQLPIPRGEAALSYHHRRVDVSDQSLQADILPVQSEDRLGLDAKVDVGPGLWFEGSLQRQTWDFEPPQWQRLSTAGLDYTFGLGNGLYAMVEHMVAGSAHGPFEAGQNAHISGLMLSYPLGILDNVRGMALYDWQNRVLYGYLGWVRTLDRWMFHLAGFWNPARPTSAVAGAAAGKGIQFHVTFNH